MSTLHLPHPYRFPWRDGNRLRLLADGERFYPALFAAIDGARRFILVDLYLVASGVVADRFIDALLAAAQRGVAVYLLLDDVGSRGLAGGDRLRLVTGGVHLRFHNPLRFLHLRRSRYRDHRKLLLADGAVAFVGGAGVDDAFSPLIAGALRWRDTMVEIHGPCVADWQALFAGAWRLAGGELPALPAGELAVGEGVAGRVARNLVGVRSEILRTALGRIRRAERRVWLATAYFLPSWKLRRALVRAARRGVEVRLLLPGPHSDHPAVTEAGRRFYGRLLRHGVRIFEYRPRFMHQKVLLCDDWVSLGSCNLDRLTLRWNLEANQEVADAPFAAEVGEMLARDFAEAVEIEPRQWGRRSRWQRLKERFWGWLDRWVEEGG